MRLFANKKRKGTQTSARTADGDAPVAGNAADHAAIVPFPAASGNDGAQEAADRTLGVDRAPAKPEEGGRPCGKADELNWNLRPGMGSGAQRNAPASNGGEETVAPGARGEDPEETIKPCMGRGGRQGAEGHAGEAAGGEETITPRTGRGKPEKDRGPAHEEPAPQTRGDSPAEPAPGAPAADSAADQEEGAVNPYVQDGMPRMNATLCIIRNRSRRRETVSFSGALWIGTGPKCELRISLPEAGDVCVEMICSAGSVYVRTLNPGRCGVLLDGMALKREMICVHRGSRLQLGSMGIEIEAIG